MDVMDDEEEDSLADNFDRALSETMAAKEDNDREVSLQDRSVYSVSCCPAGLLDSALAGLLYSALCCNLPGRLFEGILGCIREVDMRTSLRQFALSVQSAFIMCQVMPCMAVPCTIPALPWCLHCTAGCQAQCCALQGFAVWEGDEEEIEDGDDMASIDDIVGRLTKSRAGGGTGKEQKKPDLKKPQFSWRDFGPGSRPVRRPD